MSFSGAWRPRMDLLHVIPQNAGKHETKNLFRVYIFVSCVPGYVGQVNIMVSSSGAPRRVQKERVRATRACDRCKLYDAPSDIFLMLFLVLAQLV